MDDDFSQCIFTADDPVIAVKIVHHRDRLVFGGKVEQDYRFITYEFKTAEGDVSATMYLDDTHSVRITAPVYSQPIPEPVFYYLSRRFYTIEQLGGSNGYVQIWKAKKR
jgi:acetoacetate decarboxylase